MGFKRPWTWGADTAVDYAHKNVQLIEAVRPVHVVQSDLFENIPATLKSDLIVFKQPFGPGQEDTVCGCGRMTDTGSPGDSCYRPKTG